ncbi:MAG: nitroreductase family deazaflavin-dependent oxidoreductase [Acidimicrobiales bacterium]|nr:nitroreductase family deazaflavin-dependent oxidoreductase [Acidimicrobiales bacterium]MBO0893399.1 nitroreductase family deazaflavin-dependent oxidoreductase [Acidimicrobiales bacterium]
MSDASDFNTRVIEEFRANGGQVTGPMAGLPLLLVHHKGRKTGAERVNPVAYQSIGDHFAIFASKAGGPTSPDWYHNLVASPDTVVEVGGETIPVRARVAAGGEREGIWSRQKQTVPVFAEYEQRTSRQIPVVILERR